MKRTSAAMVMMGAAVLAAPAARAGRFPTRDQLNAAERGVWADDTADVLKPRQLIYETKDDGRYSVGYNLIRQSDGDVKGYFVRLTIKNLSQSPITASADVVLIDAENSVITATDRETFLAMATTLADTKVPAAKLPATTRSPPYEDIGQAYLRGRSEGAIVKADADIATGRNMTVWADSFWLKPVLELPPLQQVSGVRAFLAEPYHPLPIKIRVRIGESEFDFTTRAR